MASVISFKAEVRENKGKGGARSLRRASKVPAIIYGRGKHNVVIALEESEVKKYCYKANFCSVLVDIDVSGKKYQVLPKAVQVHPVTDVVEHLDFIHVSAETEVKVTVHLHFLNEDKCIGIKRGGMINFVRRDIELMCNPKVIPHHIDIDVSNLNIGDAIHVDEVDLPKGSRPLNAKKGITLVTVVGRVKEEEKSSDAAAK